MEAVSGTNTKFVCFLFFQLYKEYDDEEGKKKKKHMTTDEPLYRNAKDL